jgi:biotin operon repressor
MNQLRFRSPAEAAGFVMMPAPVLLAAELSNPAKVLYGLLRYYARQKQACFPSQERLSESLGYGERHVRRLLDELEAAGLITIEQRGERRTNLYWIEPLTDEIVAWLVPDRTQIAGLDRTSVSGPTEEDSA